MGDETLSHCAGSGRGGRGFQGCPVAGKCGWRVLACSEGARLQKMASSWLFPIRSILYLSHVFCQPCRKPLPLLPPVHEPHKEEAAACCPLAVLTGRAVVPARLEPHAVVEAEAGPAEVGLARRQRVLARIWCSFLQVVVILLY